MNLNAQLDDFMGAFRHEGLTFDDVSLVTQYADFLPDEADLSSRLSRRITVSIPLVSAAMDTVTETAMAIDMAMRGGIGIIHKNLTSEEQARMVQKVKFHLNGLIAHPIAFRVGQTLQAVADMREKKGYTFNGFPILDEEGRLAGILTARDIRFAPRPDAPIEAVMTRPVITASPDTTLEQAYELMLRHRIGKLPLAGPDGKLAGLYSFTDVQTLIRNVEPLYNRDAQHRLRVGAAIGPNDHQRAEILAAADVDVLVVDTAHGHSKGVVDMTRWIKTHHPKVDVISGNVATAEGALALRDAGADAVKVGIGPGSICTTRVVAGVGIPQLSAIYQCARALEDSLPIVADGGIRFSGDVAKAMAAGASTVMMGGVLAGTDHGPGEKVIYQGRQYVTYRGMGSLGAMQAASGSRERYGQQNIAPDDLVPQGVEGLVPYAGTVKLVLTQFCGGLKAALGYCGCRTLGDFRRRARFVRVTHSGVQEAHPHNITITRDSPNYRT